MTRFFRWTTFWIFWWLWCGPAASMAQPGTPADVTDRIRGQMASIQQLSHRLEGLGEEALSVRQQLQEFAQTYANEIQLRSKQSNVTDFKQAMTIFRIEYDLRLIHRLRLYDRLLNQRIDAISKGLDQLNFLHQQADDELRIAQTVNRQQLHELAARLEGALAHHIRLLKSAQKIIADEKFYAPTSKTWQSIQPSVPKVPSDPPAQS